MILRLALHAKHQFWVDQELLINRLRMGGGFHLFAHVRGFSLSSLGLEQRLSSQPALNVLLPFTISSGLVSIN
jgi:hypothetical protein